MIVSGTVKFQGGIGVAPMGVGVVLVRAEDAAERVTVDAGVKMSEAEKFIA
jgi:hypothetical protein